MDTKQDVTHMGGDPYVLRKTFFEGDEIRDADFTTPEEIERIDDIVYGEDKTWNVLDIYRRKDTDLSKLQPTIVSIHGGAWVYGDKERYQYYCMDLATRGFTVVNFTYRLAPEHPFPAALEDINTVFHWIAKHGPEYHIAPDQLFVVGDSAGAQLACQYLALLKSEEYQKLYTMEFPKEKINIRAAGLNCGLYDGNEFPNEPISKAYFGVEPEEYLPYVDVLKYINKDFTPAFVMTAVHDFLKRHAKPMYEFLKSRGVPCEYHCYGTEDQAYMEHVFHVNQKIPEAGVCNDEECEFFRRYL